MNLLRYLSTQPNLSRMQCRWMELFQEFDFDIKYVKVKDNVVVDALSMRRLASAISCIEMFLNIRLKYIMLMMISLNFRLRVCLRKLGLWMKLISNNFLN